MTSLMSKVSGVFKSSERLAKRREIRRKMAQADLLKQKAASYESRLRHLDAESEAAVTAHQEETGPIQASLDELERQILESMADRLSSPVDVETRRRELIEALHAANERLSDATARIERLRIEPGAELQRLGIEIAQSAALENSLAHQDLASPELALRAFVALQASEWAIARRRAAEKHVKENEMLARSSEDDGNLAQCEYYRSRNTRWGAELAAAQEADRVAQLAFDGAHRAVIDE